MNKCWATFFVILFLLVGIGLIFFFALNSSFNDVSGIVNPVLASQYGSLVIGIVRSVFSIVGFIILYFIITNQQESFKIQQFETKFFELVNYHRENVNQISYKPSSGKNENEIFGRDVFIELKKQLCDLYEILKPIIESDTSIENEQKQEITLNITYLTFLFGVGLRTKDTIERVLEKQNLEKELREKIITKLRECKTEYNSKIVFYGGHQSKLGFYFRQMFQTVKFVENQKYLSDKDKKQYVKFFRTQLTRYEQAILFFVSMYTLGIEWRKNGWITKYKMIKNIPEKFLGDFEPKEFFPKIKFEYEIEQNQPITNTLSAINLNNYIY